MKKIIIKCFILLNISLLWVFLSNNSNKVFGQVKKNLKKEIIVINSIYNPNIEGYVIKSNNLDLTKEGIYQIIYQDEFTNVIYEKEVEVITLDKLQNEGICNITTNISENLKYSYIDRIITSDNIIISLIKMDNYDYRVYIEKNNFNKILSKKIFDDTPCCFSKLGYIEETNEIYIAGWGFYVGTGFDNLCVKMDLNGEISAFQKITGFERDVSEHIEWDGEMFWYGGYTTSSTNIYHHETKGTDAYVLGYDPINQMTYYLDLSNEGTDNLTYLSVDESGILACHKSLNNNIYNNYFTFIDYEAEFNTYNLNINQNLIVSSIYEEIDAYYLFGNYQEDGLYNNYLYRIDKISGLDTLVGFIDDAYQSHKIIYRNKQLLLFYLSDNNIFVQIYDILTNDIILEKNINTTDDVLDIYLDRSDIKYRTRSEIYNLDVDLLLWFDDNLKYNNIIINPKITYNPEDHLIFGNYEVLYQEEFDEYHFYYYRNDEIKLCCNINNNNSYQKGIVLNCNGIAYLDGNYLDLNNNNELIISSLGGHVLVIKGHDTEDIIINFKIVDVFNNEDVLLDTTFLDNLVLNNTTKTKNINELLNISDGEFIETLSTKDENETLWYLLIPLMTGLSSFIFFYILGKK